MNSPLRSNHQNTRPPCETFRLFGGRALASNIVGTMVTADATQPRHDWAIGEIEEIYTAPLLDLIFRAQLVHRAHHRPNVVQGCVLLNVKAGGCPEDCAYCPQSARYSTGVARGELLNVDETVA